MSLCYTITFNSAKTFFFIVWIMALQLGVRLQHACHGDVILIIQTMHYILSISQKLAGASGAAKHVNYWNIIANFKSNQVDVTKFLLATRSFWTNSVTWRPTKFPFSFRSIDDSCGINFRLENYWVGMCDDWLVFS